MKKLVLALLMIAPAGLALADPAMVADTAKGPTLVDDRGMTLYTYAEDADGKSACNGPCAANWPPLAAAEGDSATGDWTVITRDDGSKQWAFKGRPLYGWVKDAKPGDITGDGVKGVWQVAQP